MHPASYGIEYEGEVQYRGRTCAAVRKGNHAVKLQNSGKIDCGAPCCGRRLRLFGAGGDSKFWDGQTSFFIAPGLGVSDGMDTSLFAVGRGRV